MKRISYRAWAVVVVAAALLGGLIWFCVQYCVNASSWVVFAGSPHVYTGGNLDTGSVTDRSGTTLLVSDENGKTYAENLELRESTLHLLGDREGYIPSTILTEYADEMVGFSLVDGLYNAEDGGSTMTLTVSAAAQIAAEEALAGRAGCVGVYNYKTGEILCAVSGPSYDPDNVPDIAGDTTGAYDGVYVNRLFQATYTPGSIFKVITAGAALEQLSMPQTSTWTCEGTCVIGEQVITCEGTHGTIDLQTALAKSCNCAFGQVAAEIGGDVLTRYVEAAGVTDRYSFDGITTAAGHYDVSDAAQADVAWSGIGQYTDLINPCGYMVFMGAVANGGTAAEPYLVSSVVTSGGKTAYTAKTSYTDRMLTENTCETLQTWMRGNVVNVYGDGYFGGLTVCAKSGTAEVGGDRQPNATFAGYCLDEDCPLAFIVVVENAGSGSAVCTSIAGTVLQACRDALQSGS